MSKRINVAGAGSESASQRALVAWWAMARKRWPGALLFAIPNGGRRDAVTGARLKAEGALAGVPDMQLAWPSPGGRWHSLFIELKKEKGGSVSKAQKAVIDTLRAAGFAVVVAHGSRAAIDAVQAYLDGTMEKEERNGKSGS